ncbi:uncharacterized protein BJ212DRAFT_459613 [Suillus subaureus]|uniref:Uncharacterized protein n=1 Tax=Suillus subaureus TaxID=48587 RepID=A0A9P7JBE2_9AGAM|nr:uncharacterized protein BJ212DRAFT_949997 [Suillus subaureus]XP_041190748.1 uncharacterized protein BJ212DRAFT_459613 [Suillus subaureus]KAG1791123.1 hypothetical protein BJ212DRAFT_949997 [Suillus subaureus]KAG1812603.1 hypothetical protein BJ212DRAFT_459613 [Suillus subaureus]
MLNFIPPVYTAFRDFSWRVHSVSCQGSVRSQYGIRSDMHSIVSSEDGHWSQLIGPYNENHARFPSTTFQSNPQRPRIAHQSRTSRIDCAQEQVPLNCG